MPKKYIWERYAIKQVPKLSAEKYEDAFHANGVSGSEFYDSTIVWTTDDPVFGWASRALYKSKTLALDTAKEWSDEYNNVILGGELVGFKESMTTAQSPRLLGLTENDFVASIDTENKEYNTYVFSGKDLQLRCMYVYGTDNYRMLAFRLYGYYIISFTVIAGDFIDEVESTDENAYPADGESGGYYYIFKKAVSPVYAGVDGVVREAEPVACVGGVIKTDISIYQCVDGAIRES